MKRLIAVIAVAAGLLGAGFVTAWSAELKVLQTQRTKDAVIALKSETGQWKQGKNAFVLEFTSPSGQSLDVGKVALSTRMAMPGMGRGGGRGMRRRAAASISLLFGLLTGTGEAVAQTPSAPAQLTVDQVV